MNHIETNKYPYKSCQGELLLACHQNHVKNAYFREFLGSLVVRTQRFHCCGPGSNPGGGTKILQALWPPKKFTSASVCPFPVQANKTCFLKLSQTFSSATLFSYLLYLFCLITHWLQDSGYPCHLAELSHLHHVSPILRISDSQNAVTRPTAFVSPGNQLEVQTLRPHSSPTESEIQGVRLSCLCFKKPSGDTQAAPKFRNYCSPQVVAKGGEG